MHDINAAFKILFCPQRSPSSWFGTEWGSQIKAVCSKTPIVWKTGREGVQLLGTGRFSRVEAGYEKSSRSGLSSGLRDGQTPKASVMRSTMRVLGFEWLCTHRTGSQISPCSLWDFSYTAAWVFFSRSEECQAEGSCILSLMSKEAGAGSLDCLDTVVGEWSFTSDKILVSPRNVRTCASQVTAALSPC